jgi:Zn-dependent peptidase ImmA (M78 family)
MESVTGVNPRMYIWARQSVGLSQEDFATKLKRKHSEIQDWEAGITAPSYAQLEKIAYEVCKRPLASFFLPDPPTEPTPEVEFRTLPSFEFAKLQPNTYIHIRKAHAFQLSLEELFDGQKTLDMQLIGQIKGATPTATLQQQASRVRNWLGISMEEQSSWKTDDLALKKWRTAIEAKGIFVFKESFKQDDISGFCLSRSDYPVIYLNNSTTKTRQIFSLLHELAHVLMEVNGLTKFEKTYIQDLPSHEQKIEQACNALAAEILIPSDVFALQTQRFAHSFDEIKEQDVALLASHFSVSRESILRRFKDLDRVSDEMYKELSQQWVAQVKKPVGAGSYYATQGAYISERFAREVVKRRMNEKIDLEKAAEYLGVKPKNFEQIESQILKGVGA